MANFNIKDKRVPKSPGPIQSEQVSSGRTGNNAPGFARDAKSELFLLATGSMFGQSKFYETAKASDDRFVKLVQEVTKADPAWMLNFLTWLRASGNMRTAAVVGSVEAALVAKKADQGREAVFDRGQGLGRLLAKAGIGRADEVGEALAYFTSKYPGKQVPKPVKRGLADAMVKLFNEYTAMKYGNSDKVAYTPDRLINLLHPDPADAKQADLFKYLLARKYDQDAAIPNSLPKLIKRDMLMKMPVERRRDLLSAYDAPQWFKEAGLTWEAMAGWLQGPMDAKAWEAIIPSMGYMALLRNLRNFDQAGISHVSVAEVTNKLMAEHEVARSKQFPFRFLAAYRAVASSKWGYALGRALELSLGNIPVLPGRTLVLVDTSGSMSSTFSEHTEMKMWDAAALFGIALSKAALRGAGQHSQVDIVSYSSSYSTNPGREFTLTRGADLLAELDRWSRGGFNIGGGTDTRKAIQMNYRNHDRVVLLTDEQANYYSGRDVFDGLVPDDRHCFTFNLAGYRYGHAPTGKFRHTFGGLTDACFPLISRIEQAQAGNWPWEQQ